MPWMGDWFAILFHVLIHQFVSSVLFVGCYHVLTNFAYLNVHDLVRYPWCYYFQIIDDWLTDCADMKKAGVHIATPHPSKQAAKTSANSQRKEQAQKSFSCNSCNRYLTWSASEINPLQSLTLKFLQVIWLGKRFTITFKG
jgi:hypothetical protein